MKLKDIIGQKFGRLTVLAYSGMNKYKQSNWKVKCACGNTCIVLGMLLKDGKTKSCGCLKKEQARINGLKNALPPGQSMINTKLSDYKYSAKHRGHKWELSDEQALKLFFQDCYYCSSPPKEIKHKGFSTGAKINGIDRVDNSKGYVKSNCVTCCRKCNDIKKYCSLHIAKRMTEFIPVE